MKRKKLILIATVVISALGILCGGVALIIKRNENAHTPMNWCVEHIKEKNKFDENNVTGFAYTGEEIRNEYSNDFDKTYFVEIVYDNWYEKWICGIAYKTTIWRLLKKDQIIKIKCEKLIKEEINSMKKKIKDLTHAEVLSICEKYYDEACSWDCPYCLQDDNFDDESNGCKLDKFGVTMKTQIVL